MSEKNHPEKRPGPFEQDRSRTPPTKRQREKDYQPEKKETGEAFGWTSGSTRPAWITWTAR